MRTATEGKVSKITYLWPRPGSDKPVEKTSFFTKVGDQICGVGPGLACAVRKSRRYCLCICGVGPIREAPRQSLLVA